MIILQTKLSQPTFTKDLVVRPRLLNKLNAGLDGALTLVVAPAGFGKTTLVSSWLQGVQENGDNALPATWLSLDEGDSDSTVFLNYFVAALQRIFPDAGVETLQLLNSRQEVPTNVLLTTLANEIEAVPTRFVMVLDDLHALQTPKLFDHLNEWLQHWPRKLHLVLVSRFNPPLRLTSLRAQGALNEIRSQDLRFSEAEVSEYFNDVLKRPLDQPVTTLLQQRLEGWIAGYKMASLFLSEGGNVNDLASALLDDEVHIADYLIEEVLTNQPPQIQRFLLKTSILDQLSVSLAETLLDEHDTDCDVRECMDYIRAADLFLIPLDRRYEWYRYHRLFRDVLQRKLSTSISIEKIEQMHALVADWYFAHDLPDLAIQHAIAAGNLTLAAAYMEQSFREVLNREDRPLLERWLRMLPEDFINASPQLLVMRAFNHGFRWELDLLAQAVQRAKPLVAEVGGREDSQILQGLFSVLEGQGYYHIHQYEQVIERCKETLNLLPAEWTYARGVAATWTGISIHATGHPQAAQQFLARQYDSYPDKGDGFALRVLLAMSINQIQSGDYQNAERTSHTMLRYAEQGQLPVVKGWAYYHLGLVNYEWNLLEAAAGYFEQVTAMLYATQTVIARNSLIGLAAIAQASGQTSEAQAIIDSLSRLDYEARGREQPDTASARARLLLMSGQTEAAERWLRQESFDLPDQSLTQWMEQSSLTKVRILLARNQGSDMEEALHILDTVGGLAESTLNRRITIEVLALRALALLNQGHVADAQETLLWSLELARRGSFTRTFVDLGPRMEILLRQVAGHEPVSGAVDRILAAFPQAEAAERYVTIQLQLPTASPSPSDGNGLSGHLTERELELLSLLAEPISLKEIATRMNITYATVRRYTINIYGKFGVHSRWEAVDSAIRQGILSSR